MPADQLVEERAPAKINLDLRVLGRRDDGYHELDSQVVFADLADRLWFRWAPDLSLRVDGPEAAGLSVARDNLVLRAAELLRDHAGIGDGAAIRLEKHIPLAGGLGGGSADAAATLRGLVRLWRLDLAAATLHGLARELGADVPVCLESRAMRMQGLGERLTPGTLPPLDLVLANPRVPVPTGDVFRALGAPAFDPAGDVALDGPPDDWRLRRNDLEGPACRVAPVISDVLDRLRALPGVRATRMSGSGATCFAVVDDPAAARRSATLLQEEEPGWWVRAVRAG